MVQLIQMILLGEDSGGPVESVESVVDGPVDPDEADDPCDGDPKSTLPTKSCVTYAPNLIVGLLGAVMLVERANLKVTMHNLLLW